MFVGLALMFGGIILVDNIKENSAKTKIANENARLLSIEQVEQYKNNRRDYVNKQLALWRSTGLPPNKWK